MVSNPLSVLFEVTLSGGGDAAQKPAFPSKASLGKIGHAASLGKIGQLGKAKEIENVAQFTKNLGGVLLQRDDAFLEVDGYGRKSLRDLEGEEKRIYAAVLIQRGLWKRVARSLPRLERSRIIERLQLELSVCAGSRKAR